VYPACSQVVRFGLLYAFKWLKKKSELAFVRRNINGVLFDIIGRRALRWVAADAVRNITSLINADIINKHLSWELHVLEVLRLKVG
jgi:hypothetical protein